MNDRGHIVGAYQDAQFLQHGFLLPDGHFTTIDFPGTISNTGPTGINNAGHIVGNYQFGDGRVHSFLLMDGNFTTIDVPGASSTLAWKINDDGVIVGEFVAGQGNSHGFVLMDGRFTTVDVPGSDITTVYDINNQGQLVGANQDAMMGRTHGFLATPVDKTPPTITVSASPATLWPPNGKLVTVTVSGTITDKPGGSGMQAGTYQVIDEYGQVQPSGSLIPGAGGSYAFTVKLQASRNGNDQDGRHYTIAVNATDIAGNPGVASATVTVPHN
jgi:probable HAF family extracellular repeat protein